MSLTTEYDFTHNEFILRYETEKLKTKVLSPVMWQKLLTNADTKLSRAGPQGED